MTIDDMGDNGTGAINLGDRRRTIRLCEFLDQASHNYQSSIAQLSQNKHTSKAYYRLLDNPKLDKNIVLEEHVKAAQLRAKAHKTVLCIQDTTELDYSSKPSIKGLGRLNYDARQGMYIHPTLMITPEGVPLGITDLWAWARKPKDQPDLKESLRWKEGYERVCEFTRDNPETRYVYVADREGDLHDIIEKAEHNQYPADYLIRAKHSRLLHDGSKLFDITQPENELGNLQFQAPRGRGKPTRKVIQQIYSQRVQLKSGCTVTILIAKENTPPAGSQAVVWRLITNRTIKDLDEAAELIDWYRKRWQIELLFNVFKTGCRIEERQLGTIEKLERLFLLYLLISYRILLITMLVRVEPKQSCEALFSSDEWQVAYKIRYQRRPPAKPISLKEMIAIVSGFGGHLGRKGDGDAGVKTIWQGLMLLHSYVYSVHIVNQIK
jgi:hypothetical protein